MTAPNPVPSGTPPPDGGHTVKQRSIWSRLWSKNSLAYLVTLLIGGGSGAFVFGVWDRIPENSPPSAQVSVTHTEGEAPLKVVVSAADSSDPDGDTLTYAWRINARDMDSTGMTFEHEFEKRGTHLVSLVVADSAGHTDSDHESIAIRDKYNPAEGIRFIESAKSRIQSGNFPQTLEDLDRWRYSCPERSIPPAHCAQLHEWAGEAEANLAQLDPALESMRTAVDHMPADQLHMVNLAEIHLLRDEPVGAINVLSDLGENQTLGAPASLTMGIAHAMNGEYATANLHLDRVVRGNTLLRAAAKYSQMLSQALAGQTSNPFPYRELTAIVCTDPSLHLDFVRNKLWVKRYVRTVGILVTRLENDVRTQLHNIMGIIQC